MSKICNMNKSTRTLNSYQFGWLIGKAQQLDGGDWRVEIEGKTELTRQLMDRFTTAKTY